MSKNNLDDILGVVESDDTSISKTENVETASTTNDIESKDTNSSANAITEADSGNGLDQDTEYCDVVSQSTSNESVDSDESDDDASCDAELDDSSSTASIVMNVPVALYRVPHPNSVVAMVSGKLYITGECIDEYLPVKCWVNGVGRVSGYIKYIKR